MLRGGETKRAFIGRLGRVFLIALGFMFLAFILGSKIGLDPFSLNYVRPEGTKGFLQSALMDGGIAVLIAWWVKEMIESDYENRQQQAMLEAAEVSRGKVLRILFGTFYDEQTVEKIYKTTFSSTLVREDFVVTYEFSSVVNSPALIRMKVAHAYKVKNVATATASFEARVSAANLAALFKDDSGLNPPRLLSAKIGDKCFSAKEIKALNRTDRKRSPTVFDLGDYPIKSGKLIDVVLQYEREKLICDGETMQMLYPTRGATVIVKSNCSPHLDFGMSEIGQPFAPREDTAPHGAEWKRETDEVLLRSNGWVLYWNDLRLKPSIETLESVTPA